MQFHLINAFDCLAIALFFYLLDSFRDRRRRGGLSYPPGPPTWPIIGNLLDVPKNDPWVAYADMSKKYGDIFCFRVFSQVIVVLCSLSAMKDLLEKRGQTYSERPFFPIAEMMDMDWPLFMTGTTETWREGRKVLDGSLRPGAMASYRQTIQEKTREFLAQLRENPKDFDPHVESFQRKLIMLLAYGYDLKDGDEIMEAPDRVAKILSPLMQPGAALVNYFPFLRHIPSWVPYFSYQPLARLGKELSRRVRNEPIDFVKKSLHDGTAVNSLASRHFQELESSVGSERRKQEEAIRVALGSLLEAGSDTTISLMISFFLALVLFPQVQRRAQAELDAVIGRDRLPTFDDRPRLPYVEAFCKEVMRWQMVAPMGLAHLSSKDDVYNGFFIPKGSVIIANAWAILHDPEIYSDPEEFKPDRFLNEDGSVRDDPTLSLVFGVGRRICPGRHLVDSILFLVTSSVLSVFNVTKAKDENGHEIPVRVAPTAELGVVARPEKFECSILPRDKVAEDLLSTNALSY